MSGADTASNRDRRLKSERRRAAAVLELLRPQDAIRATCAAAAFYPECGNTLTFYRHR